MVTSFFDPGEMQTPVSGFRVNVFSTTARA
jgi:hypothetical protein